MNCFRLDHVHRVRNERDFTMSPSARLTRPWLPAAFALLALPAAVTHSNTACAQAPVIRTERYDLPDADLSAFGNELVFDYFFPPLPAEIVKTRFLLTFETQTPGGSFDASKIGLILQPPIDDPLDPDDRVLTLFRTGADFGWSGTGTFTFSGETDELNGPVLDAPPGTSAMLYGLVMFHADRLTDPDNVAPLGGRFTGSFIEVDYVVVPEPATWVLVLLMLSTLLARVVRRRA
jgi:hypothetical protein